MLGIQNSNPINLDISVVGGRAPVSFIENFAPSGIVSMLDDLYGSVTRTIPIIDKTTDQDKSD